MRSAAAELVAAEFSAQGEDFIPASMPVMRLVNTAIDGVASDPQAVLEEPPGPMRFVLAGSGHIAGVVNPPAAGKYQYWTNEAPAASLDAFLAGATEHPGSWWPDWAAWLRGQGGREVPARGKRKPGGRGDAVIEDAPGRYVRTR